MDTCVARRSYKVTSAPLCVCLPCQTFSKNWRIVFSLNFSMNVRFYWSSKLMEVDFSRKFSLVQFWAKRVKSCSKLEFFKIWNFILLLIFLRKSHVRQNFLFWSYGSKCSWSIKFQDSLEIFKCNIVWKKAGIKLIFCILWTSIFSISWLYLFWWLWLGMSAHVQST